MLGPHDIQSWSVFVLQERSAYIQELNQFSGAAEAAPFQGKGLPEGELLGVLLPPLGPAVLLQYLLAQPQRLGRDFHHFILGNELDGLF